MTNLIDKHVTKWTMADVQRATVAELLSFLERNDPNGDYEGLDLTDLEANALMQIGALPCEECDEIFMPTTADENICPCCTAKSAR